ncbi:hypothetical protein OBBRIDRAFT_804920 [Obba rivulosa]|uniref:Uncharacterized protein n=1 Tax=Obba rivulosa TaxID=1052685 RepID=A0A8E2AQL4_9APHY|nr:hypothetical protein OBBRIDRAFT_804920 [Obba rivulosa]
MGFVRALAMLVVATLNSRAVCDESDGVDQPVSRKRSKGRREYFSRSVESHARRFLVTRWRGGRPAPVIAWHPCKKLQRATFTATSDMFHMVEECQKTPLRTSVTGGIEVLLRPFKHQCLIAAVFLYSVAQPWTLLSASVPDEATRLRIVHDRCFGAAKSSLRESAPQGVRATSDLEVVHKKAKRRSPQRTSDAGSMSASGRRSEVGATSPEPVTDATPLREVVETEHSPEALSPSPRKTGWLVLKKTLETVRDGCDLFLPLKAALVGVVAVMELVDNVNDAREGFLEISYKIDGFQTIFSHYKTAQDVPPVIRKRLDRLSK